MVDGGRAEERTVPITVDVNIPDSIQGGWPEDDKRNVFDRVQGRLKAAAEEHFHDWWDIVPQCESYPRATLVLHVAQPHCGAPYFRLRMIVQTQFVEGTGSRHTHDLGNEQRWEERDGMDSMHVPPPTPTNTLNALLDFVDREFPDDRDKKMVLLHKLIANVPVATGARWLDAQQGTLVLPFPRTPRYAPFYDRSFRLCCNYQWRGALPLTVKAENLWEPYDSDLSEALKVTVTESPSAWDPSDYEQALVYLHEEDPLWITY